MVIDYTTTTNNIASTFSGSCDINRINFTIATHSASVFFVDGLIDNLLFESNIMFPLKALTSLTAPYYNQINQATMMTTSIKEVDEETALKKLAGGDILLIIDGAESIFTYSERKYSKRSIEEPPVSNVLRGPREGFVEDLKTNLGLLRRRIATPHLKLKMLSVGKFTETKVCIAYLDGIAEMEIVGEVIKRIEAINIDGIVESSYIARYLEDNKLSLFTQVGATEKPDIVVAKMLEGRVAIVVDGSPMVLSVPFVLYEHFQASEDYYIKSFRTTLIRIIRLAAILIGMILPAIYVAFQEFQYQMLPLKFLISITSSIYGIPLTPTIEMLVVLIIFEILNEASVRMPRYVGMALSIVGAIVLGETAVNAGLLSTPAILVVAISTIGLYCVPDEVNTGSVLRISFVAVAGILGVYGILLCFILLLAYLCALENFGTAYLAPFSPSLLHDWQDGILKESLTYITERPYSIPTHNRTRQRNEKQPKK